MAQKMVKLNFLDGLYYLYRIDKPIIKGQYFRLSCMIHDIQVDTTLLTNSKIQSSITILSDMEALEENCCFTQPYYYLHNNAMIFRAVYFTRYRRISITDSDRKYIYIYIYIYICCCCCFIIIISEIIIS
ncbi:hypothetical protein ACJX0J_024049 [Zea mays]